MLYNRQSGSFTDFLDENYSCLIQALGQSLGTSIEIRDPDNQVLLSSHGLDTPLEENDLITSLSIQTPIMADEDLLGYIVAPSGVHDLSSLLDSLGDVIATHFQVSESNRDWTQDSKAA